VHAKKTFRIIAIAVVLVIALYDVRFNFVLSLPHEIEQVDSAQDALFAQCYELRDKQLHDTAFGTIDNPDVQKEFINTGRALAASECRDEYPQQWVTVLQPLRLNIIDLRARYW
jgi:hypothetical protein